MTEQGTTEMFTVEVEGKTIAIIRVVKFLSNGYPAASIYVDSRKKPETSYRYQSPDRRDENTSVLVKRLSDELIIRHNLNKPDYKVGDILVATWGYEQTNVDFFKVVSLNLGWVTLIELKPEQRQSEPTSHRGTSIPTSETIGPPFRRKANRVVKIKSYEYADKWDGLPVGYTDYA